MPIESGHNLAVKITGDLSKPTILFANGSIFSFKQFDPVYLPKLKKYLGDEYAYVQYDYVGYGNSSDLEGDFDFVTIANQQVELMDALGIDQAHLFGLSKGSIISQLVAASAPDYVISLAGYGNPNLANPDTTDRAKNDFSQRLKNTRQLSDIYDKPITDKNFDLVYNTVYVPSAFGKPVHELGIIGKIKSFWLRRKLKPMMIGPKVKIMDKLFNYYLEDLSEDQLLRYKKGIKSISVPTLLMHGTADETIPPSSSKLLADWIPNARLELIKGYSHSLPTLLPWQGDTVMNIYADFIRSVSS